MRFISVVLVLIGLISCAPRKSLDSVYSIDIPDKRVFYSEEERKLYESVIHSAPVPVRLPETIVRVLILPYTDEKGVLHSYKYMFVKLEDGKWIFTNKQVDAKEGDKIFKPLTPVEEK